MSDSKRDGTRFVDAEDLAEAERLIREERSHRRSDQSGRRGPRFSLAGMMVMTFFVCLGLSAGGDWIPAPAFAGIMGFVAIVVITWMTLSFPTSPQGRVVWVGVALAYLVACFVAVLRLAT